MTSPPAFINRATTAAVPVLIEAFADAAIRNQAMQSAFKVGAPAVPDLAKGPE